MGFVRKVSRGAKTTMIHVYYFTRLHKLSSPNGFFGREGEGAATNHQWAEPDLARSLICVMVQTCGTVPKLKQKGKGWWSTVFLLVVREGGVGVGGNAYSCFCP